MAMSYLLPVWVRVPWVVMRATAAVFTPEPSWMPVGTTVPVSEDWAPIRSMFW